MHIQIEKSVRVVLELDEIYKAFRFELDLGRSWEPTRVESARFGCHSARFAVLQFLFGVGGSGRMSIEI